MTKYNGWVNYSTWMVNLWFDNFDFTDDLEMFERCKSNDDVHDLIAEHIEITVNDYIECSIENNNGFIQDVIQSTLNEVDYHDIAKQYLQDVIDELELRQSDFSEEAEVYPPELLSA